MDKCRLMELPYFHIDSANTVTQFKAQAWQKRK